MVVSDLDDLGYPYFRKLQLFFSCCVSVVGNIAPEHPKTFVFGVSGNLGGWSSRTHRLFISFFLNGGTALCLDD